MPSTLLVEYDRDTYPPLLEPTKPPTFVSPLTGPLANDSKMLEPYEAPTNPPTDCVPRTAPIDADEFCTDPPDSIDPSKPPAVSAEAVTLLVE